MNKIDTSACTSNHAFICRSFAYFALCALAIFSTAQADARLIKYDGFPGNGLNANKWSGVYTDFDLGGTGVGLDTQRRVVNGKLLMDVRGVGGSLSDFGSRFIDNALHFSNPEGLIEISFKVNVSDFRVTGCAAGGVSFAFVRGFYTLFNDGAGDVIAIISLERSSASTAPANVLQANALLFHRTQTGDSVIGFEVLGDVDRKRNVVLRTRWSEMESLVEFQMNNQTPVIIPYANIVDSSPSVDVKSLEASSLVTDCLEGPAPVAEINARFDDVFVNP